MVRGLRPGTSYRFIVRARNSHGLSLPSPVTGVVKTRGRIKSRWCNAEFSLHDRRRFEQCTKPHIVKSRGRTLYLI